MEIVIFHSATPSVSVLADISKSSVAFHSECANDVCELPQNNANAVHFRPAANRKEFILSLSGMTCSSCSFAIQNHLRSLPFVDAAVVNLVMEEATIKLNQNFTGLNESKTVDESVIHRVIADIEDMGYGATLKVTSAVGSRSPAGSPISHNMGDQNPKSENANTEMKNELLEKQKKMIAKYRRLFFLSLVFSLPAFILSMVLASIPSIADVLMSRIYNDFSIFSLLLFLLVTPVQFGPCGLHFYYSSWQALKNGRANMSVLVATGSSAAYGYAFIAMLRELAGHGEDMNGTQQQFLMSSNDGSSYFEASSTLITFIFFGRLLEAIAKCKTSESLHLLLSLRPTLAIRLMINAETNEIIGEETVSVDHLLPGDVVKVRRGERFPSDGVVVFGSSSVDQSFLTGEPLPVVKGIGDMIIGGAVNQDAVLHVRVTQIGEQSTLGNIVRLVHNAQSTAPQIQNFADEISRFFVPSVVALATVVFFIWFSLAASDSIPSSWYSDSSAFLFSFHFGLASLVIACPCALALATPTAVMAGTGVGARMGILIKGGTAFESARTVNTIVFDKTGTLTIGKPVVTRVLLSPSLPIKKFAFLLGRAEKNSEHLLAKSLIAFSSSILSGSPDSSLFNQPSLFESVSGRGIRCRVSDSDIVVGNSAWIEENGMQVTTAMSTQIAAMESAGGTVLIMAVDRVVCAIIGLADVPKPEALAVIQYLRRKSTDVWMCTGDQPRTADAIARQIGLESNRVISGVTPQGKYDFIKQLQQREEKTTENHRRIVAMVGDGVNDSPALEQADIGISLVSGADIAVESADIVLMKNNLADVITALDLSRATFRRIQINFLFSFVYNVLGIPIAAGVLFPFVRIGLPPELAGLFMALSSVSVVLSSLWLNRYKPPKVNGPERVEKKTENQPNMSHPVELSVTKVAASMTPAFCDCEFCDCSANRAPSLSNGPGPAASDWMDLVFDMDAMSQLPSSPRSCGCTNESQHANGVHSDEDFERKACFTPLQEVHKCEIPCKCALRLLPLQC